MELMAKVAYLAGIVDGEGTIQIIRQKSRSKMGGDSYVTGGFYVTNSNLTLLHWIQDVFGGSIGLARRRVGKNWKPVHRLTFRSESAESLMRMIRPYLVIKCKQADLYLALRDRMKACRANNSWRPLSADERATREAIRLQCSQLNQRGIGQVERLSEETPFKIVS